jgi:hypothetical protein
MFWAGLSLIANECHDFAYYILTLKSIWDKVRIRINPQFYEKIINE